MLTERFDLALLMAARHHADQTRKGTAIPYLSHLLAVAAIVLEMGAGEDEAIGALLHDMVEDGGGPAAQRRIEETFGADVARIVAANSDTDEEPKPPWLARKVAYVDAIAHKQPDELRVSLADKLHNARSILADHRELGEDLWARFSATGAQTRWYYRALVDAFSARAAALGPGARPALAELDRTVAAIEVRAAGEPPASGPAAKGSRWQLQRWVQTRPDALGEAVAAALPELAGAALLWRSPVAEADYEEYRDVAFLRAVGHDGLAGALQAFWPARGPVWDGLAVVRRPGVADGVLLVEAKAHAAELLAGSGSAAKAPASVRKITAALERTATALGVPYEEATWLRGPAYQHANRLAHTLWLREQGVDAWFVHVLFAGDPSHIPTSAAELEAAMALALAELGLADGGPTWAGHVVVAV